MSPRLTVSGTNEIYHGRRLRLLEDTLRRDDGTTFVRERIEHPGAVVILPITPAGEIVVVRQWRRAIGDFLIELPAGTLEPGEEPVQCARRELIEETGYEAEDFISLGIQFPAPGFCDERQYTFLARNLRFVGSRPEEDEDIDIRLLTPEELRSAIAAGTICDGKTLALCLRANLSGHWHFERAPE